MLATLSPRIRRDSSCTTETVTYRRASFDEVCDPRIRGGTEFFDRAVGDDAAAVHHRHLVADAERALHVVGDHDARDAQSLLEPHDEVIDAGGVDRVEACRRLVVQEHLGADRDRPRESHPLAHSAGEVGRPHRLYAGQIDEAKSPLDARRDLLLAHLVPEVLLESVGDVLADAE
jgi:hypothetical protein